ncbi:MAG: hypothetical protein A2284_15890 [Deltaproteobacteria bacterium RIFOXYA12_FULL_61_11]|nr:MAG: hypothetical protein A2284_15890 [Deltaproteobacteria bacterium RIFOXYA12_FULL_61_11]
MTGTDLLDSFFLQGLEQIRWLQQYRHPLVDRLMLGLTMLGNERAYLLVLPLLWWVWSRRRGATLALAFFASAYVNTALKLWWQQPRPFQLDPAVGLITERGYGLPSGHAQFAVLMWGYLAWRSKWRGARPAAFLLALGIGLSRIWLGVHFPFDVAVGFALGAVLLALVVSSEDHVHKWWSLRPRHFRVGLVAGLILLASLVAWGHANLVVCAINGAFAGTALGLLRPRLPGARDHIPFSHRSALAFLGVTALLGLVYVLGNWLLPLPNTPWFLPAVFTRYFIIGAWVSTGAVLVLDRVLVSLQEKDLRIV